MPSPTLEEWGQLREDVGFIKSRIEALPDHENRIRVLERFKNAVPSVAVLSLFGSALGIAIAIHG